MALALDREYVGLSVFSVHNSLRLALRGIRSPLVAPVSSEWVLGSHRSGPPCGSGVGSLACLFKMGATRRRFREFALLPKRVTLKWLPRKGGSDSSPSYWPPLRNTQRNAFNRTLYMVLSSPLPAERESRRRVPPLPRRVPH